MNNSKTKVEVFSRGRRNYGTHSFVFREENIGRISEYKYLGISFNYNGRFKSDKLEL